MTHFFASGESWRAADREQSSHNPFGVSSWGGEVQLPASLKIMHLQTRQKRLHLVPTPGSDLYLLWASLPPLIQHPREIGQGKDKGSERFNILPEITQQPGATAAPLGSILTNTWTQPWMESGSV